MELIKAVDNLCLYDPEFKYIADRFLNELGDGSAVHEVKTINDLKTALNGYAGVKFLEIILHGSPGMLYLNDKTALVGTYLNDLAQNVNFLKKNARILFDSCSVGGGEPGDKFMDGIGGGLLKNKGGVIGATTVNNWTYPLFPWTGVYLKPLSFGRLKVKMYDADGNRVAAQQVDRHGIKR